MSISKGLIISNIKALRDFHCLTLREFGNAVGYDESYISKIESGKIEPSARFIGSICEEFHIKPNIFYDVDLSSNLTKNIGEITSQPPTDTKA